MTEKQRTVWDRIKENRIIHLLYAMSFFTSGLIINIAQCILFYGLKPFNKRLYRKIGYYLCYSFHCRKYLIGCKLSIISANVL